MAYIEVDHAQLHKAAEAIHEYRKKYSKHIKSVDMLVDSMGQEWKGTDYLAVKDHWDKMNDTDSTARSMKRSLNNYEDALEEAAERYKNAQSRAINRAEWLCK